VLTAGNDNSPGNASVASTTMPADNASLAEKPLASGTHFLKVVYHDGLLRITASNVSLREILEKVGAATGVSIELPPGSGTEQVFIAIGPGPTREVLESLLNGSEFNYVMTGSNENSAALSQIFLMSKLPVSQGIQNAAVNASVVSVPVVADQSAFIVNPPEESTAESAALASEINEAQENAKSGHEIPGEALDQMQKLRIAQRQLAQQQAAATQHESSGSPQ
jgi:hypothetical protein